MPKTNKLLAHDPLDETDAILREEFYGGGSRRPAPSHRRATRSTTKEKPTHYKIVCISLYTQDIERLEAMVADLKKQGHTKANKSAVIRYALDACDVSKMPKAY